MPESFDADRRHNELVERLLELTKAGSIHWTRAAGRRMVEPFAVNLTSTTIRIRSRDSDGAAPYVIQILDGDGVLVDTISAVSPLESRMFEEIYQLARHEALDVDNVIDTVIRELGEEGSQK